MSVSRVIVIVLAVLVFLTALAALWPATVHPS
jgi:hypothetical protein